MRAPIYGFASFSLVFLLTATIASAADDSRLADAAKRRDAEGVRALLKQRVNVNAPLPDGATALHWAAQWDDVETANLLVIAGANPNAADVYGVTPLSLACTNGSAEMVSKLLRSGADPNLALPSGETPLMTAARTGRVAAVSALLERGADVRAKESTRGQTALMWAAAESQTEVVKLLIEKGAEVSAKSRSGFTPLLFAAQRGDIATTTVLLDTGVGINEAASNGNTALTLAVAGDRTAYAEFVLSKGADPNLGPGYSALHLAAAEEGHVEGSEGEEGGGGGGGSLWGDEKLNFIKLLIAHGANVNAKTSRAVKGQGTVGATPFFLAAWAADVDTMRLLLANGADPNVATPQGTTPLMVAAGILRSMGGPNVSQERAFAAVKLCIELGNDVNAANASHGDTALHGAAYRGMHGGDLIAQYLIDHGAKVNVTNKRQWTPFMIAEGLYFSTYNTTNKGTADVLKRAGADPFPKGFLTNTGIRSSEVWYEPGREPATLGSEGR